MFLTKCITVYDGKDTVKCLTGSGEREISHDVIGMKTIMNLTK